MSFSRRGFVRAFGLGTAGFLADSSFVIGRGREAAAFEPQALLPLEDKVIRIGSNENARGPAASALRALQDAVTPRLGRGYPPDFTADLVSTIAQVNGVKPANVLIGTGSNPILAGAAHAYTSADRPLVTGAPTYQIPEQAARQRGAPVKAIRVQRDLSLDLGAMAEAASGAGLLFFCNPNNPTGMAYRAGVVEDFVRQVKRRSPGTAILIDEAYLDYSFDPEVKSVVHLAMELPDVFISRTLSKAHGMAGLRVGYAVGQKETLDKLNAAWHMGSMNTLSAAAAIASLKDTKHLAAEREENARIRSSVQTAFREMGYETPDSHANCILVNLGRPAAWFRDECMKRGVQIGRDFPPLEATHSRISIGTREEMERAVKVFRDVLNT